LFIGTLVAIALLCAAGVVAFVAPVRSALSLLFCIVAVAGMAYAAGAPEVAGLVLWVLGAGAGLLLLTTILLLNLTPEEVGRRRLSVRRTAALGVLLWTAAGVVAMVLEETAGQSVGTRLSEGSAARAALEGQGVVVALAFLAFLAAIVGALLVARRRA
jgi:NADH:ubiquinone oxidoreductase subunit 6 (subunit J)